MAYAAGRVRRMPLTTAVVYLAFGYLLGPHGFGLLNIDTGTHSRTIESITQIVIAISLFSGALKLRVPVLDKAWLDPLRLALLSMVLATFAAAAFAHWSLGLNASAALLLAAILAPTDPVLASDVQVERPYHFSRLRFALTGEAGMNDGAAMPLVLLGLSLATSQGPPNLWTWILLHVVWGFSGAIAIGGIIGHLGGRYMLHLRLKHDEKLGTDSFLALGLIGLSYGLASAAHCIGFVAIFAAGVAVRRIERRMTDEPPETIVVRVTNPAADQEVATDPDKAATFMLLRLLSFTENLERIGEAIVVILLGSLLRTSMLTGGALVLAPLLFFVIRPLSVWAALVGAGMSRAEQALSAWFGIRGMASVYYLAYLHDHGAPDPLVHQISEVTIGVIAYSILLHGISVTPLMAWFEQRQ